MALRTALPPVGAATVHASGAVCGTHSPGQLTVASTSATTPARAVARVEVKPPAAQQEDEVRPGGAC
jgi:hypothetical protein